MKFTASQRKAIYSLSVAAIMAALVFDVVSPSELDSVSEFLRRLTEALGVGVSLLARANINPEV